MNDEAVPLATRRQIPRVLRLIPDQRSVTALTALAGDPNLALRGSVLRALSRLRENAPDLDYGGVSVSTQVMNEARYYFQMNAALLAFREHRKPHTPAGLLVSTLEQRLKASLERLFRLLGLKYPPRQVYAAYLALNRGLHADSAAALEFLDNVLDKELKRIVIPLLDDPGNAQQRGRDLFKIDVPDVETAIRELIHSGDEWLASCAIATAAQMRWTSLAPDIKSVGEQGDGEVCQVARDCAVALA